MKDAQKLILSAPGRASFLPIHLATPSVKQFLVRSVISGISHGTEMTAFLGTSPFIDLAMHEHRLFGPRQATDVPFYPFHHLGYDNVGIVEQVGTEVTSVRVGDRVWSGTNHQTSALLTEGVSEYVKLDARVDAHDAILTNLVTVALTATNDAEIKLGDVVAVFGGGAVGQIATQLALLSGARRVFLVDPIESRRKLASSSCGADTLGLDELPAIAIRNANEGRAPDAIIECSGNVKGLRSAVQCAEVGGTVIAAGFYAGGSGDFSFAQEFLHNRITLKASMGVWGCPMRYPFWDRSRMLKETGHLIASGKLKFKSWPSITVPFDEAQHAYELIRDQPQAYMKVVLSYPAK